MLLSTGEFSRVGLGWRWAFVCYKPSYLRAVVGSRVVLGAKGLAVARRPGLGVLLSTGLICVVWSAGGLGLSFVIRPSYLQEAAGSGMAEARSRDVFLCDVASAYGLRPL